MAACVALPAEKVRVPMNREAIFALPVVLSAAALTDSLRHDDSDFAAASCLGDRYRHHDRCVVLSGRAPPDEAHQAPAGGRGNARRRELRDPRRRRGARRGRSARREFQPRRFPDRRIGRRAPAAAGQCVARIAHATVAHKTCHELFEAKHDANIKAAIARDIAELDSSIEEILLASELDVAVRRLPLRNATC